MKKTTRDEWRVTATIKPRHPDHLGLTGIKELAEFAAPTGPITVAVLPRRLGQMSAGMLVPDDKVSTDIEADYRARCEDIAAALLRLPHVEDATVTCTETHTCSHCHLEWEELTAEQATDPAFRLDEHTEAGEPACCQWAVDEFRTERGIPRTDAGVVAYRNPDRPDVLLCREHGYAWAGLVPLTSEDLPDGGTCTGGELGNPDDICGRALAAGDAGALPGTDDTAYAATRGEPGGDAS